MPAGACKAAGKGPQTPRHAQPIRLSHLPVSPINTAPCTRPRSSSTRTKVLSGPCSMQQGILQQGKTALTAKPTQQLQGPLGRLPLHSA